MEGKRTVTWPRTFRIAFVCFATDQAFFKIPPISVERGGLRITKCRLVNFSGLKMGFYSYYFSLSGTIENCVVDERDALKSKAHTNHCIPHASRRLLFYIQPARVHYEYLFFVSNKNFLTAVFVGLVSAGGSIIRKC